MRRLNSIVLPVVLLAWTGACGGAVEAAESPASSEEAPPEAPLPPRRPTKKAAVATKDDGLPLGDGAILLKTGLRLEGRIVEQRPGDSVTILIEGRTRVIAWDAVIETQVNPE